MGLDDASVGDAGLCCPAEKDETSLYGTEASRSRYSEGGSTRKFGGGGGGVSRRDCNADLEWTTVMSTWGVAVDMFSSNKVQNTYCGV